MVWYKYPEWHDASAAYSSVRGVTSQTYRILLKNQVVNYLDLYDFGNFVIYELQSSVGRCAGCEPLQKWFQNKVGELG